MAKKLKDEDLVLNIIINGDKGRKEMGQLERAVSATNKEIITLQKVQKDLIAQGKKETDAYKATTVAIEQKNKAIEFAEARLTDLRKGMKLTEMSIVDLRKEQQRLTKLMNTALPGDANNQAYRKQLDDVKGRLQELGEKGAKTGGVLQGMGSQLSNALGIGGAGIVGFAAAIPIILKVGSAYAELTDKLANVRKTTGLAAGDVYDLNDQLKDINTRTPQMELLGLATVAGKLGYSAKEDVLGFVKAADQIGVALGEDLGNVEEAVNDLGKLTDLFKLKDQFGLEDALLKTGSAVNALGAAGTANEGYIVAFTKRMGTIAPAANISVENIMGLAATMDELGQPVEAATTSLGQFMVGMGKDMPTFARVAGMSVTKFSEILKKDGNEALIAVLKNIKSTGGGVEELAANMGMVGEEGARTVATLGALSGGLDILQRRQALSNQEFAKGTSLTNEYAIKNENFAAVLEKVGKIFTGWATSGTFAKMFDDMGAALARMLGIGRTASQVAVSAWEDQRKAVSSLDENLKPLLTKYDELKSKSALSKIEQTELKNVINDISNIVPTAVTAFDAYGNAIDINKGKIKEYVEIQKALLKNTNKVAIEETNSALAEAKKRQQNQLDFLNKGTVSEQTQGNSLGVGGMTLTRKQTAEEIKKGREELMKSAAQIKELELLKKGLNGESLDLIGKNSKTNNGTETDAQKKARLQKEASEKARIAKEEADKSATAQAESNRKASLALEATRKAETEAENKAYQERLVLLGLNNLKKNEMTFAQQEVAVDLEKEHQVKIKSINDKASKAVVAQSSAVLEEEKKKAEAAKAYRLEIVNSQKSAIEQEEIAHKDRLKKARIDEKNVLEGQEDANEALQKMHQDKLAKIDNDAINTYLNKLQKRFDSELQALRIKNNTELAAITTLAQAKEVLSQTMTVKELARIANLEQAKTALKDKYAKDEANLAKDQMLELAGILQTAIDTKDFAGIDLSDKIFSQEQLDQLAEKLGIAKEKISALLVSLGGKVDDKKKEFSFLDKEKGTDILGFSTDDWELLFKNLESGKIGFGEILFAVQALSNAYSAYSKMLSASENKQLANFEKSSDTKKEKLKTQLDAGQISQEVYTKKVADLDAILDKKKAEVALKQAKRDRALAITAAIINTAVGVTKASPNVFLMALVGALGALEIGTILATPLPGKEEGGYVTRAQDGKQFKAKNQGKKRGYINETSVLVSENGSEFVASAAAVANPEVKQVLDVIDSAQKNGNVNTLSLEKMMYTSSVSRKMNGKESGGYVKDRTDNSSNTIDQTLADTLAENNAIMKKLSMQLDVPLSAKVTLFGKNGFNEAMDEYKSTVKNSTL